jgi:hypothetical protein
MDHRYIQEHDIVGRYLMGKLSAEEHDQFEEHYFGCDECLDRLEVMESFRQGMQQMSPQQIAAWRMQAREARAHWWDRLGRQWQIAIALAALLVVALPLTYLVAEVRRARQELELARTTSAEWQRRYEVEEQARRAWEEKAREAERALAERSTPPAQPPGGPGEPARATEPAPEINTPIIDLVAERSAGPTSNEIVLTPATKWFVVTMGLTERKYVTYRATITTSSGRLIRRLNGLRPDQHNDLAISFPGTFFEAGDYLLTLEGVSDNQPPHAVATYPFRIVKPKRQ